MRNLVIILILAAAALAAWFLLQNNSSTDESSAANAAEAALAQIGANKLEEEKLKGQSRFFQDEYDYCFSACKKNNCRRIFDRKCKGKCQTACLAQLQTRQGLNPIYNPTTGITTKPANVRTYNPISL